MHIILWILLGLVGVVAYIFIGVKIVAPLWWRAWWRGKNDAFGYLFYPSSCRKGRIGKYCGYWHSNCPLLTQVEEGYAGAHEGYILSSAWDWPIKVAWSIVNMAPIALVYLVVSHALGALFVLMMDGREAAKAMLHEVRDDYFPKRRGIDPEKTSRSHVAGVRIK